MRVLIYIFFFLACHSLLAQNDSIQNISQKVKAKVLFVDSLKGHGLDSIAGKPYRFIHHADSLKPNFGQYNHRIETLKGRLTHKIDSLEKLGQPTAGYSHLLDSLQRSGPLTDVRAAETKLTSLEQSINKPVKDINSSINNVQQKVNGQLGLISKEGGAVSNVPGAVNLPKVEGLPQVNQNLPGINSTTIPTSGVTGSIPGTTLPTGLSSPNVSPNTNLPSTNLNSITGNGEVGKIEQQVGQAGTYTSEAQNAIKGDVSEVKQAPQALENKASQMGELKDLKTESGQIDQVKSMAGKGNDKEALKQLAMEQARKELSVNHFAGKEKELQSAMAQVSKLKKKYNNLGSLSEIGKKARKNQMHGKPFIERFIPGITMQIMFRDRTVLDVNPQAAYRVTHRLALGAGWNERISFNHAHANFSGRVYGPRAFGEFSLAKGWIARMDVETMNLFVPVTAQTSHEGSRVWHWGLLIGLKKEYKIGKHVRGNIQTMYNFIDPRYNTNPYPDRLNVRVGFELPMKKKKVDKTSL
jgi:hypothetical protein